MFLLGYFVGTGVTFVAVAIVVVLARAYDRIKEKRNAVNRTPTS